MAEKTGIAWCDSTWNPWIGCTKVGPGCDGCYAAVSTPARSLGVVWGAGQPRMRTSAANWKKPIQWNARPFYECRDCGWRGETKSNCPSCAAEVTTARRRVFCSSLADVFDNEVDPAWRADLFDLIYNTPNLDWLLLTKRIGNAAKLMPWDHKLAGGPPSNVWLGATIVNQEEADRDIPKLLATPAAKRFVSYEPALGPVDWSSYIYDSVGVLRCSQCGFFTNRTHEDRCPNDGDLMGDFPRVEWIIVGGESAQPGHPARPFDIQWARDTVRQCRQAGVAVFVKQIGSRPLGWCVVADDHASPTCDNYESTEQGQPCWSYGSRCVYLKDRAGADPAEWPEDLRVREFPDAAARAA